MPVTGAGDAFDEVGRPTAGPGPGDSDLGDDFLDDDFLGDDGSLPAAWAGAAGGGGAVALEPLGPTARPNGQTYLPRRIGPHEDLAWLRACRDADEHAVFFGVPGTGKTALIEAAFAPDAVDGTHPGFEALICTGETVEADFTGTWLQIPTTSTFVWMPGPLHRAILHDVPLYVDEIFLAPPENLSLLYSAMDGRGVLHIPANPELEPLKIGPGFFVVAAGNPDAPGAAFSDALRSRFDHHVEVTTDWSLAGKLGVPSDIRTVAKHLDQRRRRGSLRWSPQLRDVLAYAQACRRFGQSFALSGLLAKAPLEDRDLIAEALAEKFGATVEPLALGGRHGHR